MNSTSINEINLRPVGQLTDVDRIKRYLIAEFWHWFDVHRDDKALTLKRFFFTFEVKVEHLEGVFTLLFGPRPANAVH